MDLEARLREGFMLYQQGKLAEAERIYAQILEQQAKNFDALHFLGLLALQTNRIERGVALISEAIAIDSNKALAHNNLGIGFRELKRHAEALASYDRAITLRPDYAEAYYNRGLVLQDLQRPEEALASYDRAIALKPGFAEAYNNLGNALMDMKRPEEALASYDKAIALKPNYAGAYSSRGNALRDLKRPEEALTSHDKAIALKPDLAEAYNNRGNALRDLKRPEEALASYDKAIALKPGYAEAYSNRGNALMDLKRPEEALAGYDKSIALKPDYPEAFSNRGNALMDLERPEEALASYDKAIALRHGYAEAHSNRGNALMNLGRLEEALASYNKSFALKPDLAELEGRRFYTKMRLCEWSNFDTECAHLVSSVRNGNLNTTPFVLLGLPSSSDDRFRYARLWTANRYPPSQKPIWRGERYNHDRIRVAYLSADYRAHPAAYLIAGLFERHDRSRFEVIGVSFGIDDRSEIRTRLVAAFDEFHDVRGKSDKEIAGLLHDRQVDIAIDLTGYTQDYRLGIFAYRPAPIQASYLGYPGTMGAPFIDYIVADKVVAPLEHRQFFTEKIVQLPDCFLVNDSKRKIAGGTPARHAAGLPEQGFVFCCFNNNYKITPGIFDVWMRLLHRVEGSVLWLSQANNTAIRNLRREAAARGIDPARLIFAPRPEGLDDHLARQRLADLFLDTLPYNAHATASDALWAGLPVLTCLGETFAGRVAASLLNAIHLPELVTTTLEDYERLAIELATSPEKLARVKQKLAGNRLTTPLFDTKLFTRHIEAAYAAMHERHKAGLAPDHIVVPNSISP